MKLLKDFYLQTALTAAPALLGKVLYHQTEEGRVTFGRITETEAYFGESDTACHARSGRTKRTNSCMKKAASPIFTCATASIIF